MSSSGVYYLSSYKPTGTSETSKESHSSQKVVIRRYASKDNVSDQDSEKLSHDMVSDASATKVMVFREVSSMDEDDFSNTVGPVYRRGLQKKMKLSEECTAGITESFENFCKIHRRMRQFSENRPMSSDMGKISKPYLKPSVERGLRGPRRPVTAGKLSDIAATKYPNSIFKVYIPEANRIIKKKRVIPITDIKPMTPPRSPRLTACRVVPDAPQDKTQEPVHPDSSPQTPLQTPNNPAILKMSQPETNRCKTPGVLYGTSNPSPASPQVPRKMTLITDISLTKEQEAKRLRERSMMRKRTMNSVKKVFPTQILDDANHETQTGNENDPEESEPELSGNENSHLYQRKTISISRSSLKSLTSITSSGNALTAKRSVTWRDDVVTPPEAKWNSRKFSPKRRKKNEYTYQSEDNEKNDSIIKRRARSASEASSSYNKVSRELYNQKLGTSRDSKGSTESSLGKSVDSSSKRKDKYKRSNIQERRRNERAEYRNDNTTDSERSNCKSRLKTTRRDYCSRERVAKRRQLREQRNNRNKRCTCCSALDGRHLDSQNKEKPKDFQQIRNTKSIAVNYDRRSKSIMGRHCEDDENFHYKRNAIIRKHHTCETFEDVDESDSCTHSISKRGSRTSYEEDGVRRGQSTPSIAVKSTYDDYSSGSSDSELRSQTQSLKDAFDGQYDRHVKEMVPRTEDDDKPLKNIFEIVRMSNESQSLELDKTIRKADSKYRMEPEQNMEMNQVSRQIDLQNEQTPHITIEDPFSDNNDTSSQPLSLTNSNKFDSIHDLKNEEIIKKNSKSMESFDFQALELHRRCANENVKRTSSTCAPIRIHDELDKTYLMVESYNVLTDVGHREVNDSKSLVLESSSSPQLMRESAMLNIPFEGSAKKSEEQVQAAKEINTSLPISANEVSNKSKLSNVSSCLKTSQKSTTTLKIPAGANIVENQSERKPRSRTISRSLYCSPRSSPEKKGSLGVLVPKDNNPNGKLPRAPRSPTFKPRTVSSDVRTNASQQHNNVLKNRQCSADRKTVTPNVPKSLEDRKLHLQKMLSKGESSGISRATNQIRGKWNLTQNAIIARKDKMLASIRDTRDVEKTNVPETPSRRKSVSNKNNKVSRVTEELHSAAPTVHHGAVISHNDADTTKLNNDITDSGIGEDSFEMDYLQDAIVNPGAREPQPYSSTDLLNVSFAERMSLEYTPLPCPTDDTPEKPLCECDGLRSRQRQFECDLNVQVPREYRSPGTVPELEDDDVPERDVNSYGTKAIPLGPPLRASNEYFNDTPNSSLEGNPGPLDNRNIIVDRSSFSPVRSLSVEAFTSDDNETIVAKPCKESLTVNRNVQTENNSGLRKVLSKSPNFYRKLSSSRTPSNSRDRSPSRRSKASSSGSSRRSVKSLERPPSRKPHMMGPSDDDSEQDSLPIQPSPMNIHADPMRCGNQNFIDPLKKPPPSRMYSTLRNTPHSAQESIKTAIRDLHGIKDVSGVRNESQSHKDQRAIRKEKDNPSSRPSSQMSRKSAHIPRMSPGSVRILQHKAKYVPPVSPVSNRKITKECIMPSRDGSPNAWILSTTRQEFQEEKRSTVEDQISMRSGSRRSPSSPVSNIKPPFRHCSSINKNEDNRTSPILKNSLASRKIPNYLPPWERVNLTPPERALQERALHEKKSGVINRCHVDFHKNNETLKQAKEVRTSKAGPPLVGRNPRPLTPVGGRTPVGNRSPRPLTPTGGKTPAGNRSPSPLIPTGGGTPAGNRSPRPLTPNGRRTPTENKSHIGNRSLIKSRVPRGNSCPVENRTPVKIRTPNPAESRSPQGSQRPTAKQLLQVPLVYHEFLENSSHGDSDEWKTADNYDEDSSLINSVASDLKERDKEELCSGGSAPSQEDSSTLIQTIEDENRFISDLEVMSPCSSLENISCNSKGESFFTSDDVGKSSYCDRCSECREMRKKRKKNIEVTLSKSITSVSSRFSLSLSL